MNKNNAWAWSLMLLATLLFGIGLGLSLGYAIWVSNGPVAVSTAAAPTGSELAPSFGNSETTAGAAPTQPESLAAGTSSSPTQAPTRSAAASLPATNDYWAGRHLIVTVNGQWLAASAGQMLKELRPGAVLLTESNLGSRAQTFALVREIKRAVGIGEGLGDLPLIAAQQEGGPYNLLAVENAPSAQVIGQSGDPELARRLGRGHAWSGAPVVLLAALLMVLPIALSAWQLSRDDS